MKLVEQFTGLEWPEVSGLDGQYKTETQEPRTLNESIDSDSVDTEVDAESEVTKSEFEIIQNRLVAYNPQRRKTKVVIPEGVTEIGDMAFFECSKLTSIIIPSSVTSIGDEAFMHCDMLKSITIPSSVTRIGEDAFHGCMSLKSITIPNSVKSIEWGAFYRCYSLTNVIIEDGVTEIATLAFCDCTNLKSITIPSSITSIGESVFDKCPKLTDIYYSGTKRQWNKINIDQKSNRGTVAYPIRPSLNIHFNSNIDESLKEEQHQREDYWNEEEVDITDIINELKKLNPRDIGNIINKVYRIKNNRYYVKESDVDTFKSLLYCAKRLNKQESLKEALCNCEKEIKAILDNRGDKSTTELTDEIMKLFDSDKLEEGIFDKFKKKVTAEDIESIFSKVRVDKKVINIEVELIDEDEDLKEAKFKVTVTVPQTLGGRTTKNKFDTKVTVPLYKSKKNDLEKELQPKVEKLQQYLNNMVKTKEQEHIKSVADEEKERQRRAEEKRKEKENSYSGGKKQEDNDYGYDPSDSLEARRAKDRSEYMEHPNRF